MTKCPQCNRTYAENFSYCLDDGTPLRHSTYDEATLVMPPTQPTITKQPAVSTHAPNATTTQGRSAAPIVLGVAGVFVGILLLGGIGFGIWLYSRDQSVANQNSNPAPIVASASPSPNSSYNPLTINSASPSPSPSASIEVPGAESFITPGTYQCEVTRTIGGQTKHTVAIRLQVTVNLDGTYSSKGYMTLAEANIHDQLGVEERGNYAQQEDTLILSNRRERQFDFDSGSWKRWGTPEDGAESREKVRNVTANTFQLYDDDENTWYTFSRI